MIIVSIIGPGIQQARRQARRVARLADMLELRLDLIGAVDPGQLIKVAAGTPVIATCRPVREGGGFTGTERERLDRLGDAVRSGVHYIDIEVDAIHANIRRFRELRGSIKVICSHHLRPGRKVNVAHEFRRLFSARPDVVKFAYHAADSHECRYAFDFLSLARQNRVKGIAIGMGPAGEPTRVLYRKFGGWATFASSGEGDESAPGQLSACELKEVYRAHRLNRRTRVFGLVGNPVAQSKGPYIHNAQFEQSGRNAVYCRFLTSDPGKFVRKMAPFLHGFSVTLPHKERMVAYLNRMDRRVKKTGAVNTVLRRGGLLAGTNTDAPAALDTIENVLRVAGRTILVIGAGGAARAVVAEALDRGGEVLVTGRSDRRARALAEELGAAWIPWERVQKAPGRIAEIVVNTTPVGMTPHAGVSAVPRKIVRRILAVDAIYSPPITRFLQDARLQGSRIVSGMEWFLAQAVLQSRAFGVPNPDRLLMRKTFELRTKRQ